MRRPRQQTQERTANQTLQPAHDQTLQPSPDQTLQLTPERSPPQTPMTLQHTPRPNLEPNMQNESSIADTGVWKVGSMHNDGRLQVEIIRGVLQPSGKCSSMTSGIMHERLEPMGFTWKEVSEETKKFYFEEFKKYVVWREPEHLVYAAWLKSAPQRYTNLRCKARQLWEAGRLSNRIGQNVWKSWIANWKSPEFQAKSKIKKSNRKGGVDGDGPYPPTHTGGSKSHSSYAADLAEKYKRKPYASEVHTYVHTKGHDEKTWVDEKSAKIFEKLKVLRVEHSQPIEGSIPQPVDENQLFYEAVGGRNKRNRIYGIGSSHDIFYESRSNVVSYYNSSSTSQPNIEDYQKMQAELQDMKDRMQEMDQVKQQMQEMDHMKQQMLELKAQLATISSKQN
ncbi:hypothetical protein POM88_018158 [Heracleum sosnowskyi]|uniref:Transposase n=1 Tax=Heracleum sosnowskyi TaxID=360622 RepID=A0AAD8ITW2_9APIA|nr:hypothetical protein POM88_018158 [Heracleum sosnowskyi]